MHALFAEERNVVLGMRRPLCALHRKVLSVALSVSPGKNRSHNHYSGLSLHNQESGKPKGPGSPAHREKLIPEGCQAPLCTNHPSSQPQLWMGLLRPRLGEVPPSIGQRNLGILGAEPSLGRSPAALLVLSLASS